MEDKMGVFVEKLLSWHKKRSRSFSWRKETNTYSIAVAAVLLRRTRAEMVVLGGGESESMKLSYEILMMWPLPSAIDPSQLIAASTCTAMIEE